MFASIKKSWKEARGSVLEHELADALTRLQAAGPQLQAELHKHLLPLYKNVRARLFNMTSDGHVKAGRGFQSEARRMADLDVGQGYAFWILGTWLESGQLPGDAAKKVHSFLDNFLAQMLEKFPDLIEGSKRADTGDSSLERNVIEIFDKLGEMSEGIVRAANQESDTESAIAAAEAIVEIIEAARESFELTVNDPSIFGRFLVALDEEDMETMTLMTRNMGSALGQVDTKQQKGALIHFWFCGNG